MHGRLSRPLYLDHATIDAKIAWNVKSAITISAYLKKPRPS
jgi:hypothetical protein